MSFSFFFKKQQNLKTKSFLLGLLSLAMIFINATGCGERSTTSEVGGIQLAFSFCNRILNCNSDQELSANDCAGALNNDRAFAADFGVPNNLNLDEASEEVEDGNLSLDQEALSNCQSAIQDENILDCESINQSVNTNNFEGAEGLAPASACSEVFL